MLGLGLGQDGRKRKLRKRVPRWERLFGFLVERMWIYVDDGVTAGDRVDSIAAGGGRREGTQSRLVEWQRLGDEKAVQTELLGGERLRLSGRRGGIGGDVIRNWDGMSKGIMDWFWVLFGGYIPWWVMWKVRVGL